MRFSAIDRKKAGRNLAVLGLPLMPRSVFLRRIKPNRGRCGQRWPTVTFVGLYQLALHKCVEIHGLDHVPQTVMILAGNHINRRRTLCLIGWILVERGRLARLYPNPIRPIRRENSLR